MVDQNTIEIYVRHCPNERLLEWVTSALGQTLLVCQEECLTVYRCQVHGNDVPVVTTHGVADGTFTSIFFNSPHTPWCNDVDCARQAARELQCEVRCDPVAVRPLARPDEFLRIVDGREEYINWDQEIQG
jgi:hypothetical protein